MKNEFFFELNVHFHACRPTFSGLRGRAGNAGCGAAVSAGAEEEKKKGCRMSRAWEREKARNGIKMRGCTLSPLVVLQPAAEEGKLQPAHQPAGLQP